MALKTNWHIPLSSGCFIFTIAWLLFSTMLFASDWPEFRGPTRNGISTDLNVPMEWSATSNVIWKQAIPGQGWSSPTLVDNKIYLTSATGSIEDDDLSLRALCVDSRNGQVLWNVEVFAPSSEVAALKHGKNGLASPTPLIVDDRLIVHFGHMGTAALNLEGQILWSQTNVKYDPRHGNAGSPALINDLLIYNCDGIDTQYVVALDLATGDIRWKTPRNTKALKTFSFSTPQTIQVDGVQQIVSPGSGFVAAYAPVDGRELWRVGYDEGFSVVPRPVYAHGRLYVATGFMKPKLLAINPQNASGDATQTNILWQHRHGVPNTSSVLVVGDEVYFVSDNGVASCLDAHTGKVHWTERLGGNYSSSPIFAENRIYFTSEEGDTHVIRASTEYELLFTNRLEERIFASALPDEGSIYLRSESHLWRIGN